MASTNVPEEYKRKGRARPQSTMAIQFSADLDSIFGLHKPSARDQALEEKKQVLHNRSAELAELQARLRTMEARLKHVQAKEAPPASFSIEDESSNISDKPGSVMESGARNLVLRSQQPQWASRTSTQGLGELPEQDNGRYTKDTERKMPVDDWVRDRPVRSNYGSRETLVKSSWSTISLDTAQN